MSSNGLKETLAAMERVKEAAMAAAMERMIKGANEVAATAQRLAPEDEGDLRASIAVTLPGQSTPPHSQPGGARVAGENEVIVTAGSDAVRYPHHVEHGTVKMEARPFFFTANRLLKAKNNRAIATAYRRAGRNAWNAK